MPIWVVITVIAGFFDTTYNFFSRKFLNGNGTSAEFTWWFSLIRTVIFSYTVFLYPSISTQQILSLLLLGMLNALNLYLFMRMHEVTELSVSAIITQLRIVWVPLLAVLLVSETLSANDYVGILLIFTAVLLLKTPKNLIFDKAASIAFLFSFTTSLLTVLLKQTSSFSPPSLIIFCMSFPAVFLIPIIFKKDNLYFFNDWQKTFHQKLIIALLSILLIYAMLFAFKSGGSVGKVNAIVQSMSVLTAFAGIKLLKEKENSLKKVVAIFTIIVGILILV